MLRESLQDRHDWHHQARCGWQAVRRPLVDSRRVGAKAPLWARILIGAGIVFGTISCGQPVSIPERSFRVMNPEASLYAESSVPVGRGYDIIRVITSGADRVPFGRVGGAAAFEDGGIVLYESSFCRLHTFSASLEPVKSFSGCGDGPTELRIGNQLLTLGDTIVVIDTRRNRIVRFTKDGGFISGETVNLPATGSTGIQEVAALDGSKMLASFVSPLEPAESAPPVDTTTPLIGRYDLRTGRVSLGVAMGHPVSASASGWSGFMGYPICAAPDRRNLVLLNRWAHEVAIVDARTMSPKKLVSTPASWPAFVRITGAKMSSPSAFVLGVACGSQEFIAGQFRLDPDNVRGPPLEGWMTAWHYDGTLLAVDHLTPADSALFGVPAGLAGDLLILRNNTGLDAPALVVARRRGGT